MTVTQLLRKLKEAKTMLEGRGISPSKTEVGFKVQYPRELIWQSCEDVKLLKLGAKNSDEELSLPGGEFLGIVLGTVDVPEGGSGNYTDEELNEIPAEAVAEVAHD